MAPVSLNQPVQLVQPVETTQKPAAGPVDFGSVLKSAIGHVETSNTAASHSMEQFISGESTDLHNVALATQKAALDFDMFLQVRNKVVQAYQEVMRMQL